MNKVKQCIILIFFCVFLVSCIREENIKNEKNSEISDSTYLPVFKTGRDYKNGYYDIYTDSNSLFRIKLPESVFLDVKKNFSDYKVNPQVFYNEDNEKGFCEALINTKTNETFRIFNKYFLNEKEYYEVLNLIIDEYYGKNTERNRKFNRDKGAIDVEFFDFNFDGVDEMLISSGGWDYFFTMHVTPTFIVEKKNETNKIIYSSVNEGSGIGITDSVYNGYFKIFDSNLTEREMPNPIVITVYYRYEEGRYEEYLKTEERLDLSN